MKQLMICGGCGTKVSEYEERISVKFEEDDVMQSFHPYCYNKHFKVRK